MANEYDKILRDNFKEPKAALLRRLITDIITGIRPLIPKLQYTLEREPDTVAEVQTAEGKQFIVHVEWQSSNDAKMAERMALYDLLLAQAHRQEVLGAVIYLGNEPMRMSSTYSFFRFHYECEIIDARQLDPEGFLQSDDAGEVIFAVLAGSSEVEQKTTIIRRILAKLQLLFSNDTTALQIKIRQLEMLSLLRGKNIQQIILQEESIMPITIDITQDLRYQQGKTEGKKEGKKEGKSEGKTEGKEEVAEEMLKNGIAISLVQNITGLPMSKVEEIAQRLKKE